MTLALEQAVAEITGARARRVEMVEIVARAICKASGPPPACLCGDDKRRCHAVLLYNCFAVPAVVALERAGMLKMGEDA